MTTSSNTSSVAAPPAKLGVLFTLAWPMVLGRSSQAAIGFSDALMTAPLGKESLAAVTTGAMNVFVVTVLPMGLVFIAQSFASQLDGRGELGAARRYGMYGLLLSACAGALALIAIPFVPWLLSLLDYEPVVASQMADYLEIRLLAVGAIVGVEALGNWFGGLGRTKLHMIAGLLTAAINVPLNWLLIEGHWGAPALGVKGAAIASAIASAAGLAVLIAFFVFDKQKQPMGRLRLSELMRMLRFGVPNGLSWFLEFAAFAVYVNIVIADLGTNVLAAMMVVLNVNAVSFMPAFAISSAGAILAGQAIGAGNKDSVASILWLTIRTAAVWQCTVGILYVAAPTLIMTWFAPPGIDGLALVSVGATLLALSAGWQLFDAFAMALGEALRAAGDTAWCLRARIVLAWLVFAPAAIISVNILGGGYLAAMATIIGYIGLVALVFGLRFRSGAWKNIDLTGEQALLADGG